jgi:hypothetical protein
MIITTIARPTGQLVVSTEPHPRTGSPMIVIAHHRADNTVAQRTALRPSEIAEVVAAMQLAAQRLTRRSQHRTISAAEQIAEDGKLF